MSAIVGVGAYAPRFRISAEAFEEAWGRFDAAGVNGKAVPAADEDQLTMGYEAATRALEAANVGAVDWLAFASTTPPMAEEDLTARLGAMLDLPEDVGRHVLTGSTRAGTRGIVAAADALAGGISRALVVAADAPRGEPDGEIDHAAGAGAAAFVLEADGPARIVDVAEHASPYPGSRFRGTGESTTDGLGVTRYDRRAFRETVGAAVDGLSVDPDAVAIQAPDGKLPYRAAGDLGVDAETIASVATVHELGDLGAASVPVTLARALADGHGSILAVAYGSGAGADALVVEVDGPVSTALALDGDDPLGYAEYLRQRGVVTAGPPSGGGAYVSVPTWRRSIPQRYRLEAGRCPDCGALAFPPEGACPACGSREPFEPTTLTGEGTIEAVTTISQGGAPPEFSDLQSRAGDYAAAIVAFEDEGGETVSAPAMGTDAEADAFAVGDRVEATIRRIYTQEGVTRYGFKIRPAE